MKQTILIIFICIIILNLTYGQNKETSRQLSYTELSDVLDTIYLDDQTYRKQSLELEKDYGWDSKQVQELWKLINLKDSLNLIRVEKILNEYGWLGPDVIGDTGNKTLFLVLEHSGIETQEKYLPMLEEAVRNGKAKPGYYALMKDRVLIARGEKQIYGSQLELDSETNQYILSPMIDPDNVDKRRSEVGLQPINEYLKTWNLTWDAEAFKKRMLEL